MFHPIFFIGKGAKLAMLNVDGIVLAPTWLWQKPQTPKQLWEEVDEAFYNFVMRDYSAAGAMRRAFGGYDRLYTKNRNGLWNVDRMIEWHLGNEAAIRQDPRNAVSPEMYKHSRHSSAISGASYIAKLLQVGATGADGDYTSGRNEHSGVKFAWDANKVVEYFLKLDRHFQRMKPRDGGACNAQAPAHLRWGLNPIVYFSDASQSFGLPMGRIAG